MTPTERGQFCARCQKTVVDYTALSDRELVQLLSRNSETSCGRFYNDQLNRSLSSSERLPAWRYWISLVTMGMFGWQTAKAQFARPNNLVQSVTSQPTSPQPDSLARQTKDDLDTNWLVSGEVMVQDSSGHITPALNATVTVSRLNETWLAQTDSTGNFDLSIPKRTEAVQFNAVAVTPNQIVGSLTFVAKPDNTLLILNTILVGKTKVELREESITVGEIAVHRTPSRWKTLKRKLLR